MSPGSDKVVALRRLLDERFPARPARTSRVVPTGVPGLDAVLGGGLHSGTLTELVSEVTSSGSQLSLGALLLSTRVARQRIAVVDVTGTFDPEGLDDDTIAHVVLVRCETLSETWRAADLLARDPNYAAVVVEVRGCRVRELLRTRDSVWVRLQRAAEQSEVAVVVQTDTAIVPNAAWRVAFTHSLGAETLTKTRSHIVAGLEPELRRTRIRALEVTA